MFTSFVVVNVFWLFILPSHGCTDCQIIEHYILLFQIKYRALEKFYDSDFVPDDGHISDVLPSSDNNDVYQYSAKGLEPSTKYEFRVSATTSAGQGAEAIIEVYTKAFLFTGKIIEAFSNTTCLVKYKAP